MRQQQRPPQHVVADSFPLELDRQVAGRSQHRPQRRRGRRPARDGIGDRGSRRHRSAHILGEQLDRFLAVEALGQPERCPQAVLLYRAVGVDDIDVELGRIELRRDHLGKRPQDVDRPLAENRVSRSRFATPEQTPTETH
ncbi:hypothetical protein AB0I35_06905 [Nocardia sp. NPDC050378]|uniref:hypothetical protein n=1 Tax=Nocardia sp. NPDC050378 TaxID=3155400 RepID=UPI0034027962